MDGEQDIGGAGSPGTEVLDGAALAIVITDPRLPDNPIAYVNNAFVALTGYGRQMAIGHDLRVLNGPETDAATFEQLDDAMKSETETETVLLHYREDGTPFWNHLIVTPVRDEAGTLTAFMGLLREAEGPQGRLEASEVHDSLTMLRELQHRVKNHLAMVVSMIRVQASREVDAESFHALGRRIEALALLYQEVLGQDPGNADTDVVEIGPYLRHVANVLSDIESRPGVTVSIECGAEKSTVDAAARLGLLVSELLTNALQHAFEGRETGHVGVRLVRAADGQLDLTVADDGIGMPDGLDWPGHAPSIAAQTARASASDGELDTRGSGDRHGTGVGGSIVLSLLRSLGGVLDVDSGAGGTTVRARITRV